MKKLTIISLSLSLLAGSCTKNLTDLNTNPKAPVVVPSATLFAKGEKNFVDINTSPSVSSAPFRVLSQEWTENTYVYEAQYNFAAYQAPDNFWAIMYGGTAGTTSVPNPNNGVLNDLEQAKKNALLDVLDPATQQNDRIIADILEVYGFYELVATYGDIPYSQALKDSVPFPKYDKAQTVYADLLLRLDSCINDINTGVTVWGGSSDLIYKGDPKKWRKFATTLKLKIAMLVADVDPATASAKVLEALGKGIFTSNADNALMVYDKSAVGNSNPLWQALVNSGRHDFVPTNLLVNTMVNWNDPRVPLYFTTDQNGNYSGGIPGGGNGYGINSDFSAQMQAPDYPGNILDYAETQFLLAEAAERGFPVGGTAEAYYNSAITASILFWGGTPAQAAAYLASPSVAYTTAVGTWQQKIGYQKWIANYNKSWDSWTDIRRLSYPNLDVVNPPIGAKGNLPVRFTYPKNEQTSNSINWSAALSDLPGGADATSAKLWWKK
jgi:hypothetical protein